MYKTILVIIVILAVFLLARSLKVESTMAENDKSMQPSPRQIQPEGTEKATFAAGCFWGVEARFRKFLNKGVISTQVGYTGGDFKNPKYEDLHLYKTGHHEAVEIIYDPKKIPYKQLLDIFWESHNPLRSNGQGPDIGSQYRAAIFYHSPQQFKEAEESKQRIEKERRLKGKIATMILPAKTFYPAEEYHQQYYEKKGVDNVCPVY